MRTEYRHQFWPHLLRHPLNGTNSQPDNESEADCQLLFRPIQSVRLIQWQGDSSHAQFKKLISDLSPILGPSPLKVKEAEQLRAEDEKRRREQESKQKVEEERLKKEAEAKRKTKEEQKKKEIEEHSRIEEERKHKEEEQKRRADEEQRRREEDDRKLESEEEREHRVIEASVKADTTESDAKATIESVSAGHRKTGKALKFSAAGAVPENANVEILDFDRSFQQGMELEPGKYHLQVSLEGYEPKDRLIELGAGEEKQIDFELKKIAPQMGRLFIQSVPEDAIIRILNTKQKFIQGMELEPGSYHVEVAAEGYQTERRWIDLAVGHEEPVRFKLTKLKLAEQIPPKKNIAKSVDMKLVLIPAGKFMMGSPPDEPDRNNDENQHEVRISKPYALIRHSASVNRQSIIFL